jgi:hypothetical protein
MRLGQGISVGHQRTCRAGGLCLLTVLAVILAVAAPAATASPLTWSTPRQVDHAGPFVNPSQFASLTCLSSTWCLGTDSDGNVATSTDPAGGLWNVATVSPDPVRAVSCPSTFLCVGIASNGNIVTSTNPTGGTGAWKTTSIASGHVLYAIACPSTTLCVVSDSAGDVITSTNPTGGAAAWSSPRLVDTVIVSLACPTVSLCVGAGSAGESYYNGVVTSTDPAGGAWTPVDLGAQEGGVLRSVACPSTSLCVAVNSAQLVFTSTDPTGGSGAWTYGAPPGDISSNISCASTTLCVIPGASGDTVLTSTDPAGGASTWSKPVSVDPNGVFTHNGQPDPNLGEAISCTLDGFCAAGDSVGYVATSTNPAAGTSAWQLTPALDGNDPFATMSCSSSKLCVAIDNAGRILTSTDPATSQSDWQVGSTPALSNQYGFQLSCPSDSLCLAAGTPIPPACPCIPSASNLTASRDPAAGAAGWSTSPDNTLPYVDGLSCISDKLCVAASPPHQIATSADPTNAGSWSLTALSGSIDSDASPDISCDTSSLCVVTGDSGQLFTSTKPRGDTWTPVHINSHSASFTNEFTSVSCSSVLFTICAATDNAGEVITSTDPTGGSSAWRARNLGLAHPIGQIQCPSIELCVGIDEVDGNVIWSTNPTSPASKWNVAMVDPGLTLDSLSCPTASLCVAGDNVGNVVVGTGPGPTGVTRTPALKALTRALHYSCVRQDISRIHRRGGCPTPFIAPGPGRITISWLGPHGGTIATGQALTATARGLTVHVALTKNGKKVLRHTERIKLRIRASFEDLAGHVYTKTEKVTLKN